jgi:aminoglycoside 3-N-acetyltransferase
MKITNELNEIFKAAKIKKNDVLLIHSNLNNILRKLKKNKININVNEIIFYLLDKVGTNGTLIFPTYNFDFCEKGFYSFNNSKSKMGVLSETARNLNFGEKTWHPVYSSKIFGLIPKDEINKKNYSGLGKNSIFNWINEADSKIVIINLNDQQSMTMYHHYEELRKVDWRIYKKFNGKYESKNKEIQNISIKLYVRNLKKNIKTNVHGMEKILWDKNLYNAHKKYDVSGVRSIEVKKLKKEVLNIIDKNFAKNILYNN